MKYIQLQDNTVTLIGDESVGLPLPQEFLDGNPGFKCLRLDDYSPAPNVWDRYDPDNDRFIPYAEWVRDHPPDAPDVQSDLPGRVAEIEEALAIAFGGDSDA